MDNSSKSGFMAVIAASGTVMLLAHELHKRFLSRFLKKIEAEMGTQKGKPKNKKKARFSKGVVEPSSSNEEYRKKQMSKLAASEGKDSRTPSRSMDKKLLENMPLNWQILYKGIMEYKMLKGHQHSRLVL
ncbi:hypothetical protein NMG60_11008661 [Bertholletia excelsa]